MSSWQAAPAKRQESHTVVMTAQAVQPVCRFTREDLEGYLRESGYGKNEAAFACYFTRVHPSTPPLCIACGCGLADHRTASGQQQLLQLPRQAHTSTAVHPSPANGVASGNVNLPLTLAVGREEDTTEMWVNNAGFVGAGIMILIAVVLVIVFSVVKMPIYAMVGPVVVLVLGIGFLALGKKTTVAFHTTQGSRRGDVDITTQRLVTWCCPAQRTVRVGELSNVRAVLAKGLLTKGHFYEVVCDVGNNENDTVALHSSYHGEAITQTKAWTAYIQKLQQQY